MKTNWANVLAGGLAAVIGLGALLLVLAIKAAVIGGMVYLGYLVFKMLAGG